MELLKLWRDKAYDEKANKGALQKFWNDYFIKEKEIYAQLLAAPDEVVTGTVSELAEKYNVDLMTMTGFLDGINDSLKEPNPIEEMDENTTVNLGFDKELLYKNMVAAGADWLYGLEEWEPIFDEEKRAALRSALTSRVEENKLIVLDELKLDAVKTKNMQKVLDNLNLKKALVILDSNDQNVVLSARNIEGVKTALTNTINVYDILKFDTVVLTKAAVSSIEEVYA